MASSSDRQISPIGVRGIPVVSDPASRQKILKGWNQRRIEDARVLVAGAGAIGNELIKNLVLLGFGEIYVIDFDVIELVNLNRCPFFRKIDAERKRLKAEVVAERAKELDPYGYIKITAIADEIGSYGVKYSDKIFKRLDIIFGALDNNLSRIYLTIASVYNQVPYIDGGMWGPMGNVFVGIPPDSSCFVCSLSEDSWADLSRRLECDMRGVVEDSTLPSLPTTASMVAAIQVQEALKILHTSDNGPSELGAPMKGKMISFNLVKNDWFVVDVPKRADCPVCGHVGEVE